MTDSTKAMLQCMLCSGDIGKKNGQIDSVPVFNATCWDKLDTDQNLLVFLKKNNSACIGNLLVKRRPLYAEIQSMTASDGSITSQIKVFNIAMPLIPALLSLLIAEGCNERTPS